jgi:hypothetical protein
MKGRVAKGLDFEVAKAKRHSYIVFIFSPMMLSGPDFWQVSALASSTTLLSGDKKVCYISCDIHFAKLRQVYDKN